MAVFIPGYVAIRIEEWLNPQDQPPGGYISRDAT
jgi:hypothetical protein